MEWSCGACSTPNPPTNRFCHECGAPRSAVPATETTASPEPVPAVAVAATRAADGERRYVTVMFCDMVGSTTMSGILDPEELQAIMLAYQQACADAIERNGGYIAHYMGDGILAYFGYPIADEQAAVRAVRAGLALVHTVAQRQADVPALSVRVGVHSGITVVADMGAGQQRQLRDVVGETPNIAARIQAIAAPGTVVVSEDVKLACEGYIELQPLGPHELKGLNRPLLLFRAGSDTGAANRLDVAAAKQRLTPLVGRDAEVDLLVAAWRRTRRGDGQVLWISGEPGMGKSRLVRELENRVHADEGIEIELRCSALHQSSSLHSSAEQFRRYLFARAGDLSLAAVEQLADENGTPRGLAVPVVAGLLGIPLVAPYQPVAGSADRIRQHMLDVIARLIDDRARRQPVLVVIEDLQWIDSTSAELAERFIGAQQRNDVMTVVTYRSDFTPDIPAAPHHRQMALERLRPEDIRAIIHSVAGESGLADGLDEQIAVRTEGIPLFAEELTQLLAGKGGVAPGITVPSTLRDSLMARIDRLGPEADVVRTLSVLGREATDGLLHEVSGFDREEFLDHVARLMRAGLVIRRGEGTYAVYSFKHALQQEVVYESMLRSTRRQIHARVAAALESRFAERTVTEPEMSARHFELAGEPLRALPYLMRAGDRAIAISAHDEALTHLEHARALVEQQPEGVERDVQMVNVLVKLGVPITATMGYGSAAAEQVYALAEQLCEGLGENAPVYHALYGLFRTRLLRAEYDRADEIASRLHALASAEPHRAALMVGAQRALGSVKFYRGRDHADALHHLQAALAAPDADRPGVYLGDLSDVVDPIVTCRSYAAWSHWLLGHPEIARQMSNDAITAARRLAHPFTLGLALCFDTWLCQFEGDAGATADRAAEAYEHSVVNGFPFWTGWAGVLLAWGRVQGGDATSVPAMRAAIEQWQAQGSRLGKTYFLALVGQGEAAVGALEQADNSLTEASALVEEVDEQFWMPEIMRTQAEVWRRLSRPEAEVQDLFARAEALAHSQGASALVDRIQRSR